MIISLLALLSCVDIEIGFSGVKTGLRFYWKSGKYQGNEFLSGKSGINQGLQFQKMDLNPVKRKLVGSKKENPRFRSESSEKFCFYYNLALLYCSSQTTLANVLLPNVLLLCYFGPFIIFYFNVVYMLRYVMNRCQDISSYAISTYAISTVAISTAHNFNLLHFQPFAIST